MRTPLLTAVATAMLLTFTTPAVANEPVRIAAADTTLITSAAGALLYSSSAQRADRIDVRCLSTRQCWVNAPQKFGSKWRKLPKNSVTVNVGSTLQVPGTYQVLQVRLTGRNLTPTCRASVTTVPDLVPSEAVVPLSAPAPRGKALKRGKVRIEYRNSVLACSEQLPPLGQQ